LILKAKYEACSSNVSFKSLLPGAFNVGFMGSTCTALPWAGRDGGLTRVRPYVEVSPQLTLLQLAGPQAEVKGLGLGFRV